MSSSEKPDMILKIVFAGSSGAGKTSLLNRVTEDTFTQNYMATIGVDFKIRTYNMYGRKVKVQFWDTAGQERFRAISLSYYKGNLEVN
jgi:small GTP-binding protein